MSNCREILEEYLEVEELGENRFLAIKPRAGGLLESIEAAYRAAAPRGCYLLAFRGPEGIVLASVEGGKGGRSRLWLGLLLLAATIVSVYISGLALEGPGDGLAWSPIGYLLGLLIPLAIHEAGHWLFMRRYGVPSSIPYFLPAPPLQLGFIGTFGAVINMRWLPARLRQLAVIGVAGPVAGFIAAIPVAYYGIAKSVVVPATAAGAPLQLIPLALLFFPPPIEPGPGEVVLVSPMAFSAYIVFLVTFLNLMPVAMLDGGHIVRAAGGWRVHRFVSNVLVVGLLAASLLSAQFTVFAVLALLVYILTRGEHPGAVVEEAGPDPVIAAATLAFSILLVLTLPVPV